MFSLEFVLTNLQNNQLVLINTKGCFVEQSTDLMKKYTNFSGSNAIALISRNVKYLITDGRYVTQAQSECPDFKILNQTEANIYDIINSFDSIFLPIETTPSDFVDKISIKSEFISVDIKNDFSEFEYKDFLSDTTHILQSKLDQNTAFLLSPEKVAHFFGIRSKNFCQTRIANVYGAVAKDGSFVSCDINKVSEFLLTSNIKNIVLNKKTTNLLTLNALKENFQISHNDFLWAGKMQSIKTNEEIEKIKEAHFIDAVAINKFKIWLDDNIDKGIFESDCSDAIEEFKSKNHNYIGSSFDSIIGFKENGAVIHYNHRQNNKMLDRSGIVLVDSGSQYEGLGTTDMTRVFSFNCLDKEVKIAYTVTLKSHIAIAMLKWQQGMTFSQLDTIARYKFWEIGLNDYAHGTGHGVGFCADVHEGPFNLSKYCHLEIQQNIVFSNEPGFYKPNYFGIRLENLYYSTENSFESLTWIPFNEDLIDVSLLSSSELSWLKNYQERCKIFLT